MFCWFIVLGISASFYFSGLSTCSPGCAVTSLLYFQNRTSFQLGIAIPYLSLLLVAVYFSLHIIWVALTNCKKCSVAPTAPTASTAPQQQPCPQPRPDLSSPHHGGEFLTVSEIVEQREVYEKRMKFGKDKIVSSYETTSVKCEEVRVSYNQRTRRMASSINMIQGPVMNTMIKASFRMLGISLIILVTFLCLVVPSLVLPVSNAVEDGEEEVGENFKQYLYVWKVTMWVFFISRTLQPIIIVASDKELKLKSKQFFGLETEEEARQTS